MKRHRAIITTASLLALAAPTLIPQVASAGSLLSGYGGPGQGNQAILGSALVNGPSGGSGGGGGGASGSSSGSSAEATLTGSPSTPTATGTSSSSHTGSHGRHRSQAGGPSTRPAAKTPASSGVVLAQAASTKSPALGITGADLLYILLGCAALLITGVLTVRIVHGPGGVDDAAAKGMRRRTRVVN